MTRRTVKLGAIIGISVILAYPCSEFVFGPGWLKYLVKGISLHFASPEQDALGAYHRGDLRLLGVYGYGLYVPGVEESDPACDAHMEAHGVRGIAGTSDAIRASTQWWFQQKATIYVTKYNAVLWEKIKQEATKH
jgi:hypothetical protein